MVKKNKQEKKEKPIPTLVSSTKCKMTAEFVEFQTKQNYFGEYFGLVLKNIRTSPYRKLISEKQWFHLTNNFKKAFWDYKDEELPGKKLKFEGVKETHKKGYYAYRNNVLVEHPNDLKYKVVRVKKIKIV